MSRTQTAPYGLYGIIRFNYPGHSGVGVHSGRAGARYLPGPQHPTHGCIRTTDDAMAQIVEIMAHDAVKSITITGNTELSAAEGARRHERAHSGRAPENSSIHAGGATH